MEGGLGRVGLFVGPKVTLLEYYYITISIREGAGDEAGGAKAPPIFWKESAVSMMSQI